MKRLINAFAFSLAGFKSAWSSEEAFRQEIVMFVIMVPLGLWLGQNGSERALLLGSLFIVLITELLNSGIEAAIDRISADIHPLSKTAKDVGSAAVFVSLVNVFVTWGLVLL